MPAYIKCKNLCKDFPFDGNQANADGDAKHSGQIIDGKLLALRNVSFELEEGDVLGIIGLNGAGKSTLLKILSGILKPTSGEAEIAGSITSIIEQSSIFSSDLKGVDNLIFYGNLLGYKTSFIKEKIPAILQYAELEAFGDVKLKHYSSGMKIRLAFGLIQELSSDILILDEALSVGDVFFQNKIASTLDSYFDDRSIVIMATHDFREITRYCNKCLLMENGKPAFIGDTQEAISIFYAQNRGRKEDNTDSKIVKFLSAELHSDSSEFTVGEAISVDIIYKIFKGDAPIELMLTLTDSNGPVLIDSLQFRKEYMVKPREVGTYRERISIPGNLLNMGNFSMSLMFGNSRNFIYLREDRIVHFSVTTDDKEINKDLSAAAISYPIRYPLQWESEFLGGGA